MRDLAKQREYDRTRYSDPVRRKAIIASNKSLRDRRKQELVENAGGECSRCGYKKCIAALEFHHTNPSNKNFCLNKRNMGKAWKTLVEEAAKCILLCANCHREVEESDRLDEEPPC